MGTDANITLNYYVGNDNENVKIETGFYILYQEERRKREELEMRLEQASVVIALFQSAHNKRKKRIKL